MRALRGNENSVVQKVAKWQERKINRPRVYKKYHCVVVPLLIPQNTGWPKRLSILLLKIYNSVPDGTQFRRSKDIEFL